MDTRTLLEASVEAMLRTLGGGQGQEGWAAQPFTIFRVPAYVHDANRTAYEPRMVSIGPYYNGAAGVRSMEDHKWRYLQDLMSRSPAGVSTSILIQEMRALEVRARACYSERPALGADDFVRMLLLDGCFILEFFFKWHTKEPDALLDVGWGLSLVRTDLLLLENQIPFFVVEKLYDLITGARGGREQLINLFLQHASEEKPITRPSGSSEIHHLLHLYYESFVPKPWTTMEQTTTTMEPTTMTTEPTTTTTAQRKGKTQVKIIPPAVEMSAAGVTFVRRSTPRNAYDVVFDDGRGVMEIPNIVVDDMQRPLLVNLIAFEQSKGAESRVLTSYVSLMGMLVRTAQDVRLLHRRGILDNLLADDDEAARFLSHLGDGCAMDYDRHVFARLCVDVQRYCGSWWPRHRAVLRRDYFGSPWSIISIVVAGLVVTLNAIQTYFTVFPAKN